MSSDYEAVIGLEVHAQLKTESKLFCACPNAYGAEPNTQICPICTGQPGALPVLNKKAVELGIRAALATESQVHNESVFARKNYFYPDLPKGYQISQFEKPYCTQGAIHIVTPDGKPKTIGLTRIHLEEDAGKSSHQGNQSLVDLNRAGVPLAEIVSEPDMRSSEEAVLYLKSLHSILKYAEVCDGNMEEGSFRCDANVSVRKKGDPKLGTKVELKNINSFKFVEKAIDYEIARQIDALEDGEVITQETRSWNVQKGRSEVMRSKEEAHDYRYFPEPDLPVLHISDAWIEETRATLPELPREKQARFQQDYGLSEYDASVLTASRELGIYFEAVAGKVDPKASANWVVNELLGRLNAAGLGVSKSPVTAGQLASLIGKVKNGEISGKIAKFVFEEMFSTGRDANTIIEEKGLVQLNDPGQLQPVIDALLEKNPDSVAEYRGGKVKLMGFFVGQVMKETKGQANPALVNQLLKASLDKK